MGAPTWLNPCGQLGPRPRDAYPQPTRQAAVPAVERIGEVALLSVGEKLTEEDGRRNCRELDRVLFHPLEESVLGVGRQFRERLTLRFAGLTVRRCDAEPVDLARVISKLVTQ